MNLWHFRPCSRLLHPPPSGLGIADCRAFSLNSCYSSSSCSLRALASFKYCSSSCSLRAFSSSTSCYKTSSTSNIGGRTGQKKVGGETMRENWRKKYRNLLVPKEDLTKMPSELEIRAKGLPRNTPSLGERLDRDVYNLVHQKDEKSGYHDLRQQGMSTLQEVRAQVRHDIKTRPWQSFKENFQIVREEIKKFSIEAKEAIKAPNKNIIDWYPHNDEKKKEWGFQTEEELNQWILTKDSDWGEGYSAAELSLSPLGHAVLRGELSTRVPSDGRTQAAGYVNINSAPKLRSFAQEDLMEHWQNYTHLILNVRGDGRKYYINLQVKRDFDILWNDRWHYPLFTRGGPYWQYVKIPWSKFFLGSKGAIQDRQRKLPLACGVVGMSITLMDGTSGPFQLEIKDIGLHFDPTADDEEFAYEMYRIPEFWAGH